MAPAPSHSVRLQALAERVRTACPDAADPFEITALIESYGFTDSLIREELGLPDSRVAGATLFAMLRQRPEGAACDAPVAMSRAARIADLLRSFAHSCPPSLIYPLPWVAAFVLERRYPYLTAMPPDSAAPIALAFMMSLIVAGGFVQCIARKGSFYEGVGQRALGWQVCRRIWRLGATMTTAAALVAVALALYFDIFRPRYVLLAAVHFEALALLWMTCAILLVGRGWWGVPAVFAAGALAWAVAHQAGGTPLVAQGVAIAAALAASLTAAWMVSPARSTTAALAPPRYIVFTRSLAPYFLYGIGYFAFVFADRIAAGTAVPTAAGVQFAIEEDYKRGMDVSLLLFLLSMTAVEWIHDRFRRFWEREGTRWKASEGAQYRARLRRRCLASHLAIAVNYALVLAAVWILLDLPALADSPRARVALLLGVGAYLLLELALFNALVLFTVNAAAGVLRSLGPALAINAGCGYVLGNLFGPMFAAAAMVAGAAVFAWRTGRELRLALQRPGYGCYVS